MVVLLRYLYGVPYAGDEPDSHEDSSLRQNALVYVAAEKYQIRQLRDEAYEKMESNMGDLFHRGAPGDDKFADFSDALRTIFGATMPDSEARGFMVQASIAMLHRLREDDRFLSYLADLPELAMDIVKHNDLNGNWLCENGGNCGGLPSCPNHGPTFDGPNRRSFSQDCHQQMEWLCVWCGKVAKPICSECGGSIKWEYRSVAREFAYRM
jgi:hypothetical protein